MYKCLSAQIVNQPITWKRLISVGHGDVVEDRRTGKERGAFECLAEARGQRSEWCDWLETIQRQKELKRPLVTTRVCRTASLNAQPFQLWSSVYTYTHIHAPPTSLGSQHKQGVANKVAGKSIFSGNTLFLRGRLGFFSAMSHVNQTSHDNVMLCTYLTLRFYFNGVIEENVWIQFRWTIY